MIRNGSFADVPFMRSMLAHAYAWRVNALDADIPLTRYVDNWGRTGDLALVAHETGNRVGAAWFRLFTADEPGYGFVDEQTPELSISVVPSRRRHGVGQELLDALLGKAKAVGHSAVSLSVEEDSPAVAFYERNGFDPSRRTGRRACYEARPLASNLVAGGAEPDSCLRRRDLRRHTTETRQRFRISPGSEWGRQTKMARAGRSARGSCRTATSRGPSG